MRTAQTWAALARRVQASARMVEILIVLLVVCVALYLVNGYLPLPQPAKVIINAVVVILTIVWLLDGLGFLAHWHSRWR
jgi:hypothetical protein